MFLCPDPGVRQFVPGHEWHHTQLLPPERRRRALPAFGGAGVSGYFPVLGVPVPDDQTAESVLSGSGRSRATSQNEPAERTTIPLSERSGKA